MASLTSFVRRTPGNILSEYFLKSGCVCPEIDWSAGWKVILEGIERLLSNDDALRSKVTKETQRIAAMTDDAGQAALFQVYGDPDVLEILPNGHARATRVLVDEPDAFRRAEEVRYTDEHRRGRMWTGFKGQPGLEISSAPDAIDRFKDGVRQRLGSRSVHIDIFERQRASFNQEQSFRVMQVTVYRDGPSDDVLEFIEGDNLDWRSRRPVYEAALTYEPAEGAIEVVSKDRNSREDLVRLFARELLGSGADLSRLPLRQFDLDVLLRPYEFPTDPDDAVDSVQVSMLRLMPFDTAGERITLECARSAEHTIWDMAAEHFGSHDPLQGDWIATKAKLIIRFRPDAASRRGKILPLTITMPHGCDLKDRTEHEHVVGEKYLRRWGILKDV